MDLSSFAAERPRQQVSTQFSASIGGGLDPGVRAAYAGMRQAYEDEKRALGKAASAEQTKAVLTADAMRQMSREQAEDAAIQRLEAEERARSLRAFEEDTQRQIDALKRQEIDPYRLYSDNGMKVAAVIGGLIGGLYQGINRMQSNPFIDQLNKQIDLEIARQEKELANKRAALSARFNLLGEMRRTFGDEQLAKLQARNLYYEAAKQQLASIAAETEAPMAQARAEMGIAALTREQEKLNLDEAMKQAAASRAAISASLAAQERARKEAMEERKMRLEEAKLLIEAEKAGSQSQQKIRETFVRTGTAVLNDPSTGKPVEVPTGFQASSKEEREKVQESLRAADELIDNIDKALAIRADLGMAGRVFRGSEGIWIPEWRTKLKSLEKDISLGWSRAKPGLGSHDQGIQRLADEVVRNLDSVTGVADDQLRELRERTLAAKERMIRHHAGPRSMMLPDGTVVQSGSVVPGPYGQMPQRYDSSGRPLR
jgi:hypothetical protein